MNLLLHCQFPLPGMKLYRREGMVELDVQRDGNVGPDRYNGRLFLLTWVPTNSGEKRSLGPFTVTELDDLVSLLKAVCGDSSR